MNNFFTSYWNAMKTGKLFWLTFVLYTIFWQPILDNAYNVAKSTENIDDALQGLDLYLIISTIDFIMQIIIFVIMPYIWFRKTIKIEQRDVSRLTHIFMLLGAAITTPYLLIKWNGFKHALTSITLFILSIAAFIKSVEFLQNYLTILN